jgi:hypothetical protein
MARPNAKDALVRVQTDVIITKYLKYQPKVSRVIYSLMRVSSDIIEVIFDNMFEIVKRKGHGTLEGCFDVLTTFSSMKKYHKEK